MFSISKSASNILQLNQILAANFSRVNSFTCFKAAKKHVDSLKPRLACLYFRADWNPLCAQADKDFANLSSQHLEYEFVQIDVDKAPLAKGYYSVRCEPEFLLLFLGAEMTRQTGVNETNLYHKLEKVRDFVSNIYIPKGMDTYEEFHEQFKSEHDELDKEYDEWAR